MAQTKKITPCKLRVIAYWFLFAQIIAIAVVAVLGIFVYCFASQIESLLNKSDPDIAKPLNAEMIRIYGIAFMSSVICFAWQIPMLFKIKKSFNDKIHHIALGICLILFGGGTLALVSGIMMLCSSEGANRVKK